MSAIKLLFCITAITLTFVAFVPYIRSVRKGETELHVFTWIVWTISAAIIFSAWIQAEAGMGAWPIGVSGCITGYVALLAYRKRAEITITGTDWVFFTLSISSLPIWYLTKDPLSALLIQTGISLLGFGPTYRKAYHNPHKESLLFFNVITFRNFIAIFALEQFTFVTLIFPISVVTAGAVFTLMVYYRRTKIEPNTKLQNRVL